jgi:hypothetical protein
MQARCQDRNLTKGRSIVVIPWSRWDRVSEPLARIWQVTDADEGDAPGPHSYRDASGGNAVKTRTFSDSASRRALALRLHILAKQAGITTVNKRKCARRSAQIRRIGMKFSRNWIFVVMCLAASTAWADSLELKNGSLINGKFIGGTQSDISFQVGSSIQKYDLGDVASLKFDSETASEVTLPTKSSRFSDRETEASTQTPANVTIPAGTRISVRTIDRIDSASNHVGDRFQASLEEPITANGNVVVAKGADVYGRLGESKKSGTFAGRSELQLELSGIVVNGQTVPLLTGEYELTGKSRGASTAKRTIGGAAVGSIIGAIAGGGKGAGIGAAVGGGAGAGSEIITKGDQVKIPSETLLEFTLQQDVTIPKQRG